MVGVVETLRVTVVLDVVVTLGVSVVVLLGVPVGLALAVRVGLIEGDGVCAGLEVPVLLGVHDILGDTVSVADRDSLGV